MAACKSCRVGTAVRQCWCANCDPGAARDAEFAFLTQHDRVKEPGWNPYCLMCSTMGRMTRTSFGWKCEGKGDHFGRIGCGNTIGFDLYHYPPPPLTRHERFAGAYADSWVS